jgi:hypothetical protein
LDEAIGVFEKLIGTNSKGTVRKNSTAARRFSAATRRKMAKAQKAGWAKLREQRTAKG